MQNGSSVGIYTHCKHVFARLAPFCVLRRRLLTKFLHRSSVGSSLRVRCWLRMQVFCYCGWKEVAFPTLVYNVLRLLQFDMWRASFWHVYLKFLYCWLLLVFFPFEIEVSLSLSLSSSLFFSDLIRLERSFSLLIWVHLGCVKCRSEATKGFFEKEEALTTKKKNIHFCTFDAKEFCNLQRQWRPK